ncbi:autoinducer binding domain-containing protein [Falsihalocynthiibacter arcticus]|uniref:LuxR family transcriptional regulator n=1 Tax=Falsihalocynthiibacter arcticus TaxID=1579316 RepID=A0A126UY39_9RHOB|nr:autoinducer binding domain-containing protein [Falsihalocynthiibacter arcticus]AML50566.1 LuxR family transcriptional regulator [Falsihalocynthiibacter arcticus]
MSNKIGLDLELHKLTLLAPAGYFLGLHIRFAAPLMSFQTYDHRWTDYYTEQGFALRDPTIAWGFSSDGACRWTAFGIPDTFNILGLAKEYGLNFGVTVSCGPISSRTIASFARSDREFTDSEMEDLSRVVRRLHDLTEPPESLTKAQVEALRCIADGDRHAAAAAKLNISESALKARLIAARQKLLARTTAEAIQRAKDYRLL